MNNLPISSKYRSTPDLPIPDAEREALVSRLNRAFADGVVGSDVYRANLDHLFAARTLGELVPIVESLPPEPTHEQPAVVHQEAPVGPGELVPARPPGARTVVAFTAGIILALITVAIVISLLI